MKSKKRVVIYNLETDKNSLVLGSGIFWLQAFSEEFEDVQVYSIHVGEYDLPRNVSVIEIGGGSLPKRILGFARLIVSVARTVPNRKSTVIFHHMSSRTAGSIGVFYHLLGIPQGLWYSHSHADFYLKISEKFINYFFTPTRDSFPLKSNRIVHTGHGIPTTRFKINSNLPRFGVVSIGRIARIKNIEAGIEAISESNLEKKTLHLYGQGIPGDNYSEELINFATNKGVEIEFHGALSYHLVPRELQKYSVIFSGTPKSTDKALLEGAASGCFPLTTNQDADKLTGMLDVWKDLGVNPSENLGYKLSTLCDLPQNVESHLRMAISEATSFSCDVKITVKKISNVLKGQVPSI
jgi:glycosyltransferase involved in cell wall biosynthesis